MSNGMHQPPDPREEPQWGTAKSGGFRDPSLGVPSGPHLPGPHLPGPHGPDAHGPGPHRPGPALKPGIVWLRPFTLGDVIGGAFIMYRFNPKMMIVMPLIVLGLTALAVSPFAAWTVSRGTGASSVDIGDVGTLGDVVSILLLGLVAVFIGPMVSTATQGGVIGQKVQPTDHVGVMVRRALRALLWSVLLVIAFGVMLGLCGLPVWGVWTATGTAGAIAVGVVVGLAALAGLYYVGIRLLLVPIVIYREGCGIGTAIRRSLFLTQGAFWRTLGYYLLISLITSIAANVIYTIGMLPIALTTGTTVQQGLLVAVMTVVAGLVEAIQLPFVTAGLTLMYLDRRIRVEGFEVELTRQADAPQEAWLTSPSRAGVGR